MEDYIRRLNIPDTHQLIQIDTTWKQRHGLDTDTYWYNELDENSNVVAEYIITDSTSMHPPFGRNISHEKKIINIMDTKGEMRCQSIALNGLIKFLVLEGIDVEGIVSKHSHNFLDDSSNISEAVTPEYKIRSKVILEDAVDKICKK